MGPSWELPSLAEGPSSEDHPSFMVAPSFVTEASSEVVEVYDVSKLVKEQIQRSPFFNLELIYYTFAIYI